MAVRDLSDVAKTGPVRSVKSEVLPPKRRTSKNRPPIPEEKYSVKTVAEALEKARGLVSGAAQIMQCSPQTVRNYLHRYPELKQVQIDVIELIGDMAVMALMEGVKDKNARYVERVLDTSAKDRGFSLAKSEPTFDPDADGMENRSITVRLVRASPAQIKAKQEILAMRKKAHA